MSARRRRVLALPCSLILAVLAVAPASGAITQRFDLETADFSQWKEVQSACTGNGYSVATVGDSCASVVTSPRRDGAFAARYRINPWANGASAYPRAEAYIDRDATGSVEGQEWYYAWSTLFPSADNTGWWAKGGNWNYFTQVHGTGPVGAIFAFGVDATTPTPSLYFQHVTKDSANLSKDVKVAKSVLGPLRFDRWYDFAMRVRWSSSPERGAIEIWVDGSKWLVQEGVTLPPGGAYLKQGFYGGAHSGTNVVYHDGMRRASTLADVLAATPSAPAAPPGAGAQQATPPVVLAPAPPPPPVVLERPKQEKQQPQRSRKPAVRATAGSTRVLRWEGRRYTSARQLRESLGSRGVGWERFLGRYPAVARTFGLVSLRWGGRAHYSRASLARRLATTGTSYRRFVLRHPTLAERLVRNDRR